VKRLLLTLLVASLLGAAGMRFQAVSADCNLLPLWVNIISSGLGCLAMPFGASQTFCPMEQVNVSTGPTNVNGDQTNAGDRFYQYDLDCGSTDLIRVSAEYNSVTQRGTEKVTGDSGYLEGVWNCSNDPWIDSQPPNCANLGIEASNNAAANFDVQAATLPISSVFLSTYSHHVLDEQLGNALKQVDQTAPTPEQSEVANSCIGCVLSGAINSMPPTSIPVLPDFAITRISGPTQLTNGLSGTYEIVLANLGAKPSQQVQVEIQVNGSLSYLQMTQTPNGFDCLGNRPIICTGPIGGYGDPMSATVADFQLQAQGSQAGQGSISASANPSGSIQESSTSNNGQTLTVTVN
jgi:CARDB